MATLTGKVGQSGLQKGLDFVIRSGLLLIVLLAPLPFGSVEPWAFSALELSVAAIGLLWLYRLFLFPSLPVVRSLLYLPPLLFLLLMVLQLVPLPPKFLRVVSPNTTSFYEETVPGYSERTLRIEEAEVGLAGESSSAGRLWFPISQHPSATRTYLLKGVAFLLFLFLVLNAFRGEEQVRRLLYAFVAGGFFQAFYALVEYLSGHQHIFAYQKKYYTDAATGTFINRNHFAGFLEMTLLVALGLLLSKLRGPDARGMMKERLLAMADRRASLNLSLALSIGIIAVSLILSFSRAGIVIGLAAAGVFCLRRARGTWSLKKTAVIALLAIAVLVPAYGIGYWELTGRYAILTHEFSAPGGRLTVWENTWSIFTDFPQLGTGVGTFQYVFPRYRAASVRDFYDYAHNDYVQVLSEAGIPGAILVLWGIYLVGRVWFGRISQNAPVDVLKSAVGFGLLAIALHEFVDFGLQIPANLLALTFLVGCLSLLAGEEGRQGSRREPLLV